MMNILRLMIPAVVFACIYQASSQTTYIPTTDPLTVTTDFPESYVERTTDDTVGKSVEIINAQASYTGSNVNITNNKTTASSYDNNFSYGIHASRSKYISLDAADGTWNTITMNAGVAGIYLENLLQTSTISNTKIYMNNGMYRSTGIAAYGSALVLDNVNVYQSGSQSDQGIFAHGVNASITNKDKGQVTIDTTATQTGSAIAAVYGTVDLYNTTIKAGSLSKGVLYAGIGSNISLTNSKISSSNGNMLIALTGFDESTATCTVTLNSVNLDNAKNQVIKAISGLNVNLSHGTNFDGYAVCNGGGTFYFDINSGASWNVTQNSKLDSEGYRPSEDDSSLSLGVGSTISFVQLSEGTFTNITSASIALEAGAILMLGATADEIQALLDGHEGTYNVKLFETTNEYTNEGVILVTSDGRELEYTPDNWGTYTITGILPASIPEPATATLGLAALGLLALRRRMNN